MNNKKLNYEDSRYVQFCMLELQKQEIFESGIVPDGWLPSDDKTNQKINELSDSIDKKYKKKLNRGGQMVDDLIKMG